MPYICTFLSKTWPPRAATSSWNAIFFFQGRSAKCPVWPAAAMRSPTPHSSHGNAVFCLILLPSRGGYTKERASSSHSVTLPLLAVSSSKVVSLPIKKKKKNMQLSYFLLISAVFSTVIAEAQPPSSSLDNLISFVPQDILPPPPTPDQGTSSSSSHAVDLGFQGSNGQIFQDFEIPNNQQIGPNPVFDMALARPNSQEEKVDDETAHYRSFNCNQQYSVCCEGRDHSIDSQHMPCTQSNN